MPESFASVVSITNQVKRSKDLLRGGIAPTMHITDGTLFPPREIPHLRSGWHRDFDGKSFPSPLKMDSRPRGNDELVKAWK